MANRQVIDTDSSPGSSRRNRWREVIAVAAPLVALVIVLGGFSALTFYGRQVNKRDVLALTQDLVTAVDQRVRTRVEVFLRPAAQAVRLTGELARGQTRTWAELDALFEDFALAMMRSHDELSAFYIADPHGRFTMVQREDSGSLDTKRIRVKGNRRSTVWTRRGANGEIKAKEPDPSDQFDPRSRSWYTGAVGGKGVFWSDLYVFFSSQRPGITVSKAVRGPNGALRYVVGADIELASLSGFLADLGIGKTGQAVILEAGGQVLATPNPKNAVVKQNGVLRPARVEDLSDPLLREIFDRARVQRDIHRVLKVGDKRYITAASSLEQVLNRPLWLIISAPESDFTGFIARNNRNTLLLSALIVALALALTGLLLHFRLSAERRSGALEIRRAQLDRLSDNHRAMSAIAADGTDNPVAAIRRVSEQLATSVGARRAMVWAVEGDDDTLKCVDCYDAEGGGHSTAGSLRRIDFPKLFNALDRNERLLISDAEADPRTQQLYRRYLLTVASQSLIAVPIAKRGKLAGVVWVEDSNSTTALTAADIDAVLGYAAAVLRPLLSGDTGARPAKDAAVDTNADPASASSARDNEPGAVATSSAALVGKPDAGLVQRQGRRRDASKKEDRIRKSSHAAVLWVTIDAGPVHTSGRTDVDVTADRARFVQFIAQTADANDVPYVRHVGDQFVLADGFDHSPRDAARAVGRVAIALQTQCKRIFSSHGGDMSCRIGLDVGSARAEVAEPDSGTYNLWGEAVDGASRMAASAPERAIQLSESAYAAMKDDFAVSRRGVYYMEDGRATETYLLHGEV